MSMDDDYDQYEKYEEESPIIKNKTNSGQDRYRSPSAISKNILAEPPSPYSPMRAPIKGDNTQ